LQLVLALIGSIVTFKGQSKGGKTLDFLQD
jgi:hypothetical protein